MTRGAGNDVGLLLSPTAALFVIIILMRRLGKDGLDPMAFNSANVDADSLGFKESDIKRKVPYKQNRAVLFHSSYFHETQRHKFKPGYTNRRINYTLLFGYAESIRCSNCAQSQGDFCTGPVGKAAPHARQEL